MKKLTTIIFAFVFLTFSYSQNVNNKINSGGISNNNISYEVGLINVPLVYEKIDVEEEIITDNNKLSYFPNQVTDKLYLLIDGNIINNNVQIYNELGQILINKTVDEEFIDLSTLKAGVYFVIINNENAKPFKIIKN